MSAPEGQPHSLPGNDNSAAPKPTLADHHWRAGLRARSRDDLEQDMLAAIETNNAWRFKLLLQLDPAWAEDERFMAATIRHRRADMFMALSAARPGWEKLARLNPLGEEAAKTGELAVMQFLIEKCGLDIHYYSDEPLRAAAAANQPAMLRYLVSKGADVNAWNGEPLRQAAADGFLEVVKVLVENGAELESSWNGPLERAAESGHAPVVAYLLEKGADAAAHSHAGFTAAAREGHADVLKAFLRHGVSANAEEGAALIEALGNAKFNAASTLLAEGADINAQNGKALRSAAYKGELETVRFLLEHNANPNLSEYRDTALTEAARADKPEFVALLMQHGADAAQLQSEAWHIAKDRNYAGVLDALAAGEAQQLARVRQEKTDEFNKAFGSDFTIDDLRRREGPSGETGLLIAAQSGQFAALVGRARGGLLQPADLFHPDDRVDSVFSALVRHESLQDFFAPPFWTDRVQSAAEAHALLPEDRQKDVNFAAIVADINQRNLRRKAASGKLRPPGV